MTDYLGPLSFGKATDGGTYALKEWSSDGANASLEVMVQATSKAALSAAIEALAAQLKAGNTYAHNYPGGTTPVVYTITGVTGFRLSAPETWYALQQRVSFTLSLSTLPRGALTTLYNAQAVSAPASLSLAALLGTNPPTLDITVDDDAGTDMHSVICALAPSALSDAKWLIPFASLTWTTMSNGTGADCWGNTSRYTTSAAWQTALLDTAAYPAGKYRLWVRSKQSAGTGYVKDSQGDTAVAIARTTHHLTVVGDLDLPIADTAPGVAANLTLSCMSDGSNTFTGNAFLLIPLDLGYFQWHHTTPATEIDQLDVGPSGVYMDGSCDTTHFRGSVLVPKTLAAHVGTLVATASPTGSDWPADWDRTDSTDVTAASSKFHVVTTVGSKWASYAVTVAGSPLVVPGAWYELSFTRNLSARVSGYAEAYIYWLDVDGNTVRVQQMSAAAATDAGPTLIVCHAKAPVHAARARVYVGAGYLAEMTVDFSGVVLRRCPLNLIVVAEDAGGALTSYVHPVKVTLKYQPKYEVSR